MEILADCCKIASRDPNPIIFGAICRDLLEAFLSVIILVFLLAQWWDNLWNVDMTDFLDLLKSDNFITQFKNRYDYITEQSGAAHGALDNPDEWNLPNHNDLCESLNALVDRYRERSPNISMKLVTNLVHTQEFCLSWNLHYSGTVRSHCNVQRTRVRWNRSRIIL